MTGMGWGGGRIPVHDLEQKLVRPSCNVVIIDLLLFFQYMATFGEKKQQK